MYIQYHILWFFLFSFHTAPSIDEASLKAAYIERFTKFVEWPQSVDSEYFTIQIIGEPELYRIMNEQFRNYSIKNKKVRLISSSEIDPKRLPQVIFIGNHRKIPEIKPLIKNLPVLTIASGDRLCESGIMINLFAHENRLRFEINELLVRESGLYMNYRLLQMAMRIIYPVKKSSDEMD
jgi:hypothetical protein